ncbi:melatonin receptor type 1A-like [Paramacrobiotus metropolitanus]|uniref:melatonin receptor type 1A-like n=1 Tax=Paramacrobiotus metropolitanus TaxID=2943436 RepID=UPI00244650A5|nr:melatonin receptor type 1A-like [Paramacrobiotus metropolitanus]
MPNTTASLASLAGNTTVTFSTPTEVFGIITIPISLVGTAGSIGCLGFIRTHAKQQSSSTNALYINLSIATLLFCGIVCPVHAYTQLAQQASSFAQPTYLAKSACSFIGFFYFWTLTASAYSHSAIAANRLFIVVLQKSKLSSTSTTVFLIAASWFIAGMTFMWPLLRLGGTYGFSTESMKCTFSSLTSPEFVISYKVLYGFVPVIIMVICYAAVFCKVAISSRKLRKNPAVNQAGALLMPVNHRRQRNAERKITQIAFITCVGFIVCYVPSAIFGFVVKARAALQSPMGMALVFLMWIGCAANPLLYTYLNSDLKKRVHDVLKRRLPFAERVFGGSSTNGNSMSLTGVKRITSTVSNKVHPSRDQ